jgi:putative transposase
MYYYRDKPRDSEALKQRIRDIAHTRVHYGYRRVQVMLKREGFKDNHKRVYRCYKELGLSLRYKRPKRNRSAMQRQPLKASSHIGQVWSMDFVADNLFDGRKLRLLTVVDCYTRQCVAIEVGQRLKGEDVVRVLEQAIRQYGKPITIKSDNGSEFVGKIMDKWLYENKIKQDLSRPGKPTDNAYIESFNGRLRQECLNEHWFMSLADAKAKIEAWRNAYNTSRPHSALDWMTPNEFARQEALKSLLPSEQTAVKLDL